MAAQVTTVHPNQKVGLGEAIGRAFQAYQAYTSAKENNARTDYYNKLTEDAVPVEKQADFIKAGGTIGEEETDTSSPVPARVQNPETGESEIKILHFSPPEKEMKPPAQKFETYSYRDEKGQNRIGKKDIETQTFLRTPDDPLAASQPKDLIAAADAGDKKDKDKHFQTVQSLLEGMRGNPAVQQAEKDIYAAQKVNQLIEQNGGDPNNLTTTQAALLAGEIGKIAQGGAPTQHELDILTPQTLESKFSTILAKIKASPSPANLGAFLQQYKDYADGLTRDAQKLVEDRYGRILRSNKSKLHPDDYNSLNEEYVNRFKNAAEEAGKKLEQDKEDQKAQAIKELEKRGVKVGGS